MQPTRDNNLIVFKFADSKIPEAKITPGKDWVSFGDANGYPDYLLYLYNKSSKHNAIVNGKSVYIFGGGVRSENEIEEIKAKRVNLWGEGLNEIVYKCVLDVEIFSGYYLKVVYNSLGSVAEIYHIPFQNIRVSKDGEFLYRDDWCDKYARTKPVVFAPFNPNAENKTSQIFQYKEYRPGTRWYPLPTYIGSINYIETDIKISQYHLSAISNGMFPSKMIQFFNGEPDEEGKSKIEKKFKDKFTGSENAGGIMLAFNSDPAKAIQIQDLSATELDKQFTILNDTVQQEIFSGHSVTTPSLFGVMTAGKLGESTQLKEGFEIFKNTYVSGKQKKLMEGINYVLQSMGYTSEFELKPVDPIGFSLSEAALLQLGMSDPRIKAWLIDKAGIEIEEAEPLPGAAVAPEEQAMANDHIKNMTGRQMQNIARIARKYAKGELTHAVATMMLKNGFGLSDADAETFLTGGEDV